AVGLAERVRDAVVRVITGDLGERCRRLEARRGQFDRVETDRLLDLGHLEPEAVADRLRSALEPGAIRPLVLEPPAPMLAWTVGYCRPTSERRASGTRTPPDGSSPARRL